MKKIFTLFFSLFFLTLATYANQIYVWGYVKNASGVAVANQAVTIVNDSLASGSTCGVIYHVKYTNANGFYSDTLVCSGNITSVKVSTSNCAGSILTNTIATSVQGGNYESSFVTSCNSISCVSSFNNSVSGFTAQFINTSIATTPITNVLWSFGDGTSSTLQNPSHTYTSVGIYNVKLKIITNNCSDSSVQAINIANPTGCNANFDLLRDSLNYKKINLFAAINTAYPNNDPVIERKWKFGDGDSLLGNVQNPTHTYANVGIYTVCLRVKTQNGCVSELCKTVVITNPASTNCYANYTYTPQATLVNFNSSNSYAAAGDSIISRRWVWGDSTAVLTGNVVNPQHQYAQQGVYYVCLTIKTASGCEKTFCNLVTATSSNTNCVPQFITTRTGAVRTVLFNSSMSWTPANDSIVERKWNFGDGTGITVGNIIQPTHTYTNNGIYTACLRIKTASGCINEVCKPVVLQDSIVNPPAGVNEPVKILNLYPNPAHVTLQSNIWSANNNVAAELAIYDVYGQKKWFRNVVLSQGVNIYSMPVGSLLNGPYIFKVKTIYGVKSRQFFKI